MFVANTPLELDDFLSEWLSLLGEKKFDRLKETFGYLFYSHIFCNIIEERFSVLYSTHVMSAPNCPVNCLVGAIILCHKYNWSIDELMRQIDFNIEVRVALGLSNIDSLPFSRRTYFNFQNRLSNYYEQTGINLLETVFEDLTSAQLESLGVKSDTQRLDSVLINSNIGQYTRISLLVEVLCRLYKSLDEHKKSLYGFLFEGYELGGEKYIYGLSGGDQKEVLEGLALSYYRIYHLLPEDCKGSQSWTLFSKVYDQHFKELSSDQQPAEDTLPILVVPSSELGSDTVQSPDDLQATYRSKGGVGYKGYNLTGVETCDPENPINLVTKVIVSPNNKDDAQILEDNFEDLKSMTPDLEEVHLDGGFGSPQVDKKAKELDVTIVQTAVKGKQAQAPMEITDNQEQGITVQCANADHPPVEATKTPKGFKAVFDLNNHCEGCPFYDSCPTKNNRNQNKGEATFRFNGEDILKQQRHRAIVQIPKERRALRCAVENLMRLLRRGEKNTGKLKIRGLFKFELYGIAMGIVINIERIFKYLSGKATCFFDFIVCFLLTFFMGSERVENIKTH